MADHQDYSTDASGEDEAGRLLKKILSPAEAQSLVLPPPDHAPANRPAQSTPLTGSLAKPPSQAIPSRSSADDDNTPVRRSGLARYFAASAGAPAVGNDTKDGAHGQSLDRSSDPQYVKISSKGQVGYLPKANLPAARQIDQNLKVLGEG